jgi:hypothetical protein
MKFFFSIFIIFGLAINVYGQPSESQIKKDVGNAGVISFRFTKSTGTRQWNHDVNNWEYVRGVEVVRNSDVPGVKLIVVGDAVYQYRGGGGYSYWKFRIISNKYEGIDNPSEAEIMDLINANPQTFFGHYYFKIVNLIEKPKLLENPNWIWHRPTSVEFKMKAKFESVFSDTETEVVENVFNVRLYKDNMNGPWLRWVSMASKNNAERKVSEKYKYSVDELRKKPKLYQMK